jgi:hypothetical protein
MFATLVINAVYMTVASAVMFALRGDTRSRPEGATPPAVEPAAEAVDIPRQHGPVEPRSGALARP